MKVIWKWIRHNQGAFVALIIVCGLMVWNFGCESKVQSLKNPDIMVNAEELALEIESVVAVLNLEAETILAQGELRMEELEKMDEFKRTLINFAAITADAQTVNPAGLLALVFSILGFGAVVDNRIKDKVIKNRPLNNEGGRDASVSS